MRKLTHFIVTLELVHLLVGIRGLDFLLRCIEIPCLHLIHLNPMTFYKSVVANRASNHLTLDMMQGYNGRTPLACKRLSRKLKSTTGNFEITTLVCMFRFVDIFPLYGLFRDIFSYYNMFVG